VASDLWPLEKRLKEVVAVGVPAEDVTNEAALDPDPRGEARDDSRRPGGRGWRGLRRFGMKASLLAVGEVAFGA
jgi:hypothetical protein